MKYGVRYKLLIKNVKCPNFPVSQSSTHFGVDHITVECEEGSCRLSDRLAE